MVLQRPAAALLLPLLLAARAVSAQQDPIPLRDSTDRIVEASASEAGTTFEPSDFGDGRRTLGRFVPNLGRNLVGVFSKDNLGFLAAGAAFTGISTAFDDGSGRLLRGHAEEFGELGQRAGTLSTVAPLAFGLFAAGRTASDPRLRGLTYDIAQATIVSGFYTEFLKRAVGRERPDGSDSRSFPSGHTSNAFAWASIANHHYGAKVGLPAYAAASLIGISRIERDKHHLSDVVAGAALGLVVGRTVSREDGEPLKRGPRLAVVPMADANGAGVGAGVHVEF